MSEPIRRTVSVRCPVEHAFRVFTHRIDAWWPAGHRRFDRSTLTLEAEPGGRFFERAPDGREVVLGKVLTVEAPHHITYTWHPGAITAPTAVEIRFTADGELTRVDVTHHEADAAMGDRWPERAALFTRAWSHVLPAFAAAIAAATPLDREETR